MCSNTASSSCKSNTSPHLVRLFSKIRHNSSGGITDEGRSRPAQKPQSKGMRGTRERDQTLATRGGTEYYGPKVARQHFYAVAKGRREGVFLFWEETEPLVKGFSGAVHQRFDSLDEAMQYLNDWDHRRLPEPNVSAVEMEKLRLFNAQRRSKGTTSEAASSYNGPTLSQEDLRSVEYRMERGIGYQGGSGVEGAEESVAYQEVEAIHHDNRELGKDWDHGEEQSVDIGELSGSDDSIIITEVRRRTQLDPGNTQLRRVLAEAMKEAKSRMTLGGSGSRDARGDPRRARVARERWVERVLAHVPRADLDECPSFWPCMETSQERKVTEMESDHLIWTPTAESAREWTQRAAFTVASIVKDRQRAAMLSKPDVLERLDELASILRTVTAYAPPHQDAQAAVLRGLAGEMENDSRRGHLGPWVTREQETLPFLWSAAVNLKCLCRERDMLLDRAEWIDSVEAGIWHQGLPCKEQQVMSQSMPTEVLDALEAAERELRTFHSKCYQGLRARGGDLLR
jgi:hypothetical protein